MTIDEFRIEKEDLENDILDLINNFEDKTTAKAWKVDLGGRDDDKETEYVFITCNI